MGSISPARPSIEPSLRVREPSAANTRYEKTSVPSGYCSPGLAVEEATILEPAGCIFATTVAEEFVRADAMTVSMATTPLASVQCTPRLPRGKENAAKSTESILGHCKPARSPRPSQVTELRLTTNEVGVLTTPHVGHGLQTRAASAACGTRRSFTDKTDGSLTKMALSTVLRPRGNSLCEPDSLDLLSAVGQSDVSMDDFAPTAASFQLTCEGTKWCAVVAAHIEAVHRLATIDITSSCGVAKGELSKLTMIATEKAGLQICFQLATWGDAQREITFRRRLEMCELQRLTRLYQTFVTTPMSPPPADGENKQWPPRSLEDDSHLPEGVVASNTNNHRRVSEDRRQLVSEFETTLEDMQSMLLQKEQELQHLASQLEEERRCSGQNVAVLQSQLITMRLDHACMDKELESISTALIDTQESCNVLRQLITESEEQHRFHTQQAQQEYTALQKEQAHLINHYEAQITSLNEQLREAHKKLDALHNADITDTPCALVRADTQNLNTPFTAHPEQNNKHNVLSLYTHGIVDAVRSEYEAQTAELVDSAELVEARDALGAAEQRCAALAAAHAEAVAALEAKSAASESELAAARVALCCAAEGCFEKASPLLRVCDSRECFVAGVQYGVEVLRDGFESRANEVVGCTRRIVSARAAVEAARRRCAEVSSKLTQAKACGDDEKEFCSGELVAAHAELRAVMERYLEAEAAVDEEEAEEHPYEALFSALSRELKDAREKLKTMQQLNRMLREKFRSDLQASERSSSYSS
ncbi:hypothetical protein, conserved [Leishmania donovani]|uniref:Uncharacterized protein n=1 Tax=Leishmania donovani TaxID=5661 RepID=E9BR37_LEIDO|nr:hypothetical protein, conserved [Leishmania donovani]CBZ37716.1 hypothetical protein, conserved [Leishmania donovani]